MTDTEFFFSLKPAFPWSVYPLGWPALGAVAGLLTVLTIWTYLGHPQAHRRRVLIVLTLRLLALLVVLLTAVRPSVGVQEDPKLPSTLLMGVDLSESMSVRDEIGGTARIEAVRATLTRAEPIIEELKEKQNIDVILYAFGSPDFSEDRDRYDPQKPADAKRSDYGTYLNRTFQRWQTERFLRGHLIIGDGIDNGTQFRATEEAARWKRLDTPISTFSVGKRETGSDARDVAITAIAADPAPVPIKQDLTLKLVVNAFGFIGANVPVKVQFDTGDGKGYQDVATERATLAEERDNTVLISLKAPDLPGEVKVRVEIPITSVPGDVAPANNVIESYLTVTREGVRVLIVNRLSFEHAAIRRALAADKRIDVYEVIRQTDEPPSPSERAAFDFQQQAYDVIIIGNISGKQLTSIDPQLPAQIAEQVTKKGAGLLFTGGHATFTGTPGYPDATGWGGITAITDILPVDLTGAPPVRADFFTGRGNRYQYLPTARELPQYVNRLGASEADTIASWLKLNSRDGFSRFTGLSRMGTVKPTATLYAVASDLRADQPVPAPEALSATLPPVLAGHQIGDSNRGRVLALAAQDTYLWQRLGQPQSDEGMQFHSQFWRQLVLWLAHQEEEEGAAFARPEFRRLPVGGPQKIEVGLRAPGGAPAQNPQFEVKVIAPGETAATARTRPVIPTADGKFQVPYDPTRPGEYIVQLSATGQNPAPEAAMAEVKGEAVARFLVYAETTDEMLRVAAEPLFLQKLAEAGGGTAHRLEELPAFLKELANQPNSLMKPKPHFYPDWRRNHSGPFLPMWLVLFALLLGGEWALRRLWGMV
ncbi:MAG: hypothetical protein LC104_14495 [Bacteroidales bacterium]|nr:hypothetical protein [Bacteroidales bacterium]